MPVDAEVIGSKPQRYAVHIHSATPQLEGYQAFAAVRSKLKGESAYLIDIGNRTVLVTQVSASGRILNRRPFDECGVYGIADRIVSRESLAAQLKTPRPQQVIDYLLDRKHGPDIAEQIAGDLCRKPRRSDRLHRQRQLTAIHSGRWREASRYRADSGR